MGLVYNNILTKTGIGIFFLGLAVALPSINMDLLINFGGLSDDAITILRLGLIAVSIGVVVS